MKTGNSENLDGKRGKKGGTQFPRYSLSALNPFLSNLTNKTHTNSLSIEQLNAGVFNVGANSSTGKIKSSALKQFGLIEGEYKKLKATELCSQIVNSDSDEKRRFFQESFAKVSVFANAMKTFHNSKYEKSKIAQYATTTLKVHPEFKDEFVKVLVESAEIAGLCTVDGNSVFFSDLIKPIEIVNPPEEIEENDNVESNENQNELDENPPSQNQNFSQRKGQASNINVNIDVDSSMDSEKLEKLLKLLKNYGAI